MVLVVKPDNDFVAGRELHPEFRRTQPTTGFVDHHTAGKVGSEEPKPADIVIVKNYPSCFFGTSLASTLMGLDIDTTILIGCSTSGCVRATAIDAIQYGYRVIVPSECVGDRHDALHEANLFDINAKYGDVVSKAEAIKYLNSLP